MIRVFFGSPGAGKTTEACKMMKNYTKSYNHIYCNFDLSEDHLIGKTVDLKDLGLWTFPEYSSDHRPTIFFDDFVIDRYCDRYCKTYCRAVIR